MILNVKKPALLAGLVLLLSAGLTQADDNPAPDLASQPRIDGLPSGLVPWRDPENPNVQLLDPGWNKYYLRKDMIGDNPKREPGPIDLQRYHVLPTKHAFPSYFGLPIAMTTEDLKAGNVDVAMVGAPSSFNPADGTGWAAIGAHNLRFRRKSEGARGRSCLEQDPGICPGPL